MQRNDTSESRNLPDDGSGVEPVRTNRGFSHIPVELIEEIFRRCMEEPTLPTSGHGANQAVLSCLLLVCHSWNSIALSMPYLWSFIHVKPNRGYSKAHIQETLQSIKYFLERSKGYPLTLTVSLHTHQNCMPLLNSIVDVSSRWRSVCFDLPRKLHRTLGMKLSKRPLPTLQEIRLHLSDLPSSYPDFFKINDAYKLAPALTSLTTSSFSLSVHNTLIPWNQLTSFEGPINCYNLHLLFIQAPRLLFCTILIVTNGYYGGTLKIETSSLRSLRICSIANWVDVFSHLSLPTVEILDIPNDRQSLEIPISNFITTCTSITTLIITINLPDEEVLDFLRLVPPSLSILHLKASLGTWLFRGLTCTAKRKIVPNLRKMKLNGGLLLSEDLICPMVWSRWKLGRTMAHNYATEGCSNLESLTICCRRVIFRPSNPTKPFFIERLRGLVKAGFDFAFFIGEERKL